MTQEQKKEFEKTIKEINQKQFRLMTGFVNQGKDRTGLDLNSNGKISLYLITLT